MDVQTTDGKAALMRYVCSYVSKLTENVELLRNIETSTFNQVWPFLVDLSPGEPEMTMSFSYNKMSYCNLSRVKITPPKPEFLDKNDFFSKYINRCADLEELTCLEFCRDYTMSTERPSLADKRNVVGVKYKYIFNPRFFYEFTIMNTPFRQLNDIRDPLFLSLPENLREFSFLRHNFKDYIFTYQFRAFLENLGYNDIKIFEFLNIIKGFMSLYERFLMNPISIEEQNIDTACKEALNIEQQIVFNHVLDRLLETRDAFPNAICTTSTSQFSEFSFNTDSEHTTDSDSDSIPENSNPSSSSTPEILPCAPKNIDINNSNLSSIKPILLKGKPGTGKTRTVSDIAEECVKNDLPVLFVTPTANLARTTKLCYSSDLVTCETVHSMFYIPIDGTAPTINFSLIKYAIIIIDEVGMVTLKNMQHVQRTINVLPSRPVLLLVGDPFQQNPLETVKGVTSSTLNIFNSYFEDICTRFTLCKQNRFECDRYEGLLNIMRVSSLTNEQVRTLNLKLCVVPQETFEITIIHAFRSAPHTKFLTITKRGCQLINETLASYLFSESTYLGFVLDTELQHVDIYEGLPIYITENINKRHGIVNGQEATVIDLRGHVLFIRLSNGSEHFLYSRRHDEHKAMYFPFLLNFATTIFKCQGKNLKHVTVWLDRKLPSPGAAYVAFSRVKNYHSVSLLEDVNRFQLTPINQGNFIQGESESEDSD